MKGNEMSLTQRQKEQWKRDGYLFLRQILPKSVLVSLRKMFSDLSDEIMQAAFQRGLIENQYKDDPLEKRLSRIPLDKMSRYKVSWMSKICRKATFQLFHSKSIVSAVQELLPGNICGYPVYNGWPKLPQQNSDLIPWHQDSAYFGEDSYLSEIITCWVPIVRCCIKNGCLQLVPGSHLLGELQHARIHDASNLLEICENFSKENIVNCELEPCDIVMFNNRMVHRSLVNKSNSIRWSLNIRYIKQGEPMGKKHWAHKKQKWIIRNKKFNPTPFRTWQKMVYERAQKS